LKDLSPRVFAIPLTSAELLFVRRAVAYLVEIEGDTAASRNVAEMLRQPLEVGQLSMWFSNHEVMV
jgi:hypothetical protein